MAQCEMCGRTADLVTAVVEGTQMRTCRACAGFGKTVEAPPKAASVHRVRSYTEPVQKRLVADFAKRVRDLRESKGLTQAEFAARIGERQGTIAKMESGAFLPTIGVAEKIEREFRVVLTAADESDAYVPVEKKQNAFTLGDFVKIKK